jgi:prephenate dehydrogenase
MGINVEDVRIDHATGHRLGSLDILVLPDRVQDLVAGLSARGWRLPDHAEADATGSVAPQDSGPADG